MLPLRFPTSGIRAKPAAARPLQRRLTAARAPCKGRPGCGSSGCQQGAAPMEVPPAGTALARRGDRPKATAHTTGATARGQGVVVNGAQHRCLRDGGSGDHWMRVEGEG
ncbi:hypothetical protein B296_00005649 [Ensete ventricosum]|uniref:Uncharacterized protein n=1 Tax=Ensete ventricosum TaxID=4639 RepID=A0A426ZR07_ENSVE|nr:hypothetical protein B296_00005649 [Ensete ventricosum]